MPQISAADRRWSEAGFTLLELMVVLTIAVGMTVAAGTAFGPRAASLDETSNDVVRYLKHARHGALVTGEDQVVRIDARAGRFERAGAEPLLLPDGLTVEASEEQAELLFFAAGGATGAALTLQRGTDQRDVEIRWLTGAVVASGKMP